MFSKDTKFWLILIDNASVTVVVIHSILVGCDGIIFVLDSRSHSCLCVERWLCCTGIIIVLIVFAYFRSTFSMLRSKAMQDQRCWLLCATVCLFVCVNYCATITTAIRGASVISKYQFLNQATLRISSHSQSIILSTKQHG